MSSTPFRASKIRLVAPRKLLKNGYGFQAINPPRQSTYINNVDKKRRSESVRASSQENHENHIKSFTKIHPREFWQENHARKFHHVGLPPSRENQEDLFTGTLSLSSRCLSSSPTLLKIWSRFPDPEELMDAIIAIPVYHASGGVTSTVTPPVMS